MKIRYICQNKLKTNFKTQNGHWVTSLFGLVFRSVFLLSPKTYLIPEFWSQSEVRIS